MPAKLLAVMSPARKYFLKKAGIDEPDLPDLLKFTFNRETISKAIEIGKKIPLEVVKDRFIFGTPDDVIEKLEAFLKAGAEHFVLTPLVRHSDYIPTIRTLSEKVIPYFRN